MVEETGRLVAKKRHLLLAIVLIVLLVGYLFVTRNTGSSSLDHGDWRADMAQVISARAFASSGVSSLDFGAVRDSGTELGLPPYYLTHGSPFPAMALGYLYSLGLTAVEARILPLLISASALLAIYLLACRVVGDWRAGFVAALALAAAAPFRLQADSFAYPTYDFAAKTWTMLFISLGCLSVGWRRLAWLEVAGLASLATIALSGLEVAPAIGAYAVLFPLFFAASAGPKERRRVALFSGFRVGFGLLLGMFVWVGHNALLLGRLDVAVADFSNMFVLYFRPVLDFTQEQHYMPILSQDYTINYSSLLVSRAVGYFPIHLIGIALAFGLGAVWAGALHRDWDWRPFTWLAVIFFSDILWFLLFRGHTAVNTYTIYHLDLSVSLTVAITFLIAWRVVTVSASSRYVAVMAGAALFAASFAYLALQPRGNLEAQVDLTEQKRQFEAFASFVPLDGVVVLDIGGTDPSPEFFLGRTFVRRQWLKSLDSPQGRPWFLITRPDLDNDVYTRALSENLLLKKTSEFALFDMNVGETSSGTEITEVGDRKQGGLQR